MSARAESSKENSQGTVNQRVNLTDEQRAQIAAGQNQLAQTSANQNVILSRLAERSGRLADQARVPGAPGQLDNTSRALISREQQNRQEGLNAQQAQIQRRFDGPAGQILSQIAQTRATLANNPLSLLAAESQAGRQAQENQNLQQGQGLINNQAQLGQQQVQNQTNFLQTLGQLGELLGGRTQESQQQAKKSSKGVGIG